MAQVIARSEGVSIVTYLLEDARPGGRRRGQL